MKPKYEINSEVDACKSYVLHTGGSVAHSHQQMQWYWHYSLPCLHLGMIYLMKLHKHMEISRFIYLNNRLALMRLPMNRLMVER